MANNLSTGIGLSGQFDYRQTGLEPVLMAERDLAGSRAREQQQKNRERKALEDEVRKMTLMDHGLKIPLYQRQWESTMAGGITDIIEKVRNGDDDAYTAAWNLQRKMKNYTQDLKAADAELYGVYEAVRKDPEKFAWNDPQEIMGKKYNNFFEVLKDPAMVDVNNMKEAMKYYGGTEYLLQENDPESVSRGAPPFTVHYNPQEMVNPLDYSLGLVKEKGQFDELHTGKPYQVGGKWRAEELYRMRPETIDLLSEETFNNMGVLRSYEERLFKNRPDKSMTRAEFQKTDWLEDAKALHEQEIKPHLQRQAIKQGTIDVTPPAQKEAKPTTAQKAASEAIPDGAFTMTGDTFKASFSGKAQKKNIIEIPEGTEYKTVSGKSWSKMSDPIDLEATPVRIEWNGPGKDSYIMYQSKLDPKGESIKGIEESFSYRIPLNKSTLAQAAGIYGTTSDLLVQRLVEGAEGGPAEQIQKWYTSTGGSGDPSQLPGGRQKVSPQDFNAKWASLKPGESLVGPDGKTYTKK